MRDLDVKLDLTTEQSSPETVAEAASLRRRLKHQRIDRIAILIETVCRHHEKISLAIERLLMALRPVERMELPASKLIALTQRWYARRYNTAVSRDELHATRKTAKLARYMLESAPNSILAKRTAKKLEEIQHRGGQWHDWLQLTAAAASTLGKEHRLTELYNQKRNSHFGCYRKTLAEQHRYLRDSKKA